MSTPNSLKKNNLLPRYHQQRKRVIQRQLATGQSSPSSSHSSHSSQSSSNNLNRSQIPPTLPHHPPKLNVPPISITHHPSLPHLMPSRSPTTVNTNILHSNSTLNVISPEPHSIKRTASHETTVKKKKQKQPLFHQIQHDVNAYIQRFLLNASKRFWYCNEYSVSRDMIACTPLSYSELVSIHNKSYRETILKNDVRNTPQQYIHMIDARIGATSEKIYNGTYGIFQTFVDKNNHISFIYNDKLIHDKLCQINLVHFVSANINWKEYSNKLKKELSSELLGPYKSYALDKFHKLLHREFKVLSLFRCVANITKNESTTNGANGANTDGSDKCDSNNVHKKGLLISLLQQQLNHDDDVKTACSVSPTTSPKLGMDVTSAVESVMECYKSLKHDLNCDGKRLMDTNKKILDHIKNAKQCKDREKSKNIKQNIEDYVQSANDMMSIKNKPYNAMKKYVTFILNEKVENSGKYSVMMTEIDTFYEENKKQIIYGKQLLDLKLECILYNENVARLKREFHGKNKRFKKEIKDRIGLIKNIDLNTEETESSYLSISAKIRSIIRFSKHNMKAGTMQILKTILNNVQNMCPPHDNESSEGIDIDFTDIFSCNILHESIVLELEKQQDLCDKLLSKLQDYAAKKQKRLYGKMKQIGMMDTGKNEMNGPEFEEHEYHGDDIIFRVNDSGEYVKRFLLVVWKNKIYRVYTSEVAYLDGKEALFENHFRATDYGYNGLLTVDVRRSSKTKKTSSFKGYQFILAKHAFVVKDMLSIKYWRNYIQRGENIRKAHEDWEATNRVSASRRTRKNNENTDYNSRKYMMRRARSSSLV